MKKVISLVISFFTIFLFFNFTVQAYQNEDEKFTSLKLLKQYPSQYEIYGISPSGEKVITINNGLQVISTKTKKSLAKFAADPDAYCSKKIQWSKDETKFILIDADKISYENLIGKSENYYIYDIKSKSKTMVTNEDTKTHFNVLYAPALSINDQSMFYTFQNPIKKLACIYKIDFQKKQKSMLFKDDQFRYLDIQSFEIADGLLICEKNCFTNPEAIEVFLLDEKTRAKTQIIDGRGCSYLEIKSISKDHKTILINQYKPASNMGEIIFNYLILKFDNDFKKFTMKTINCSSIDDNNKLNNMANNSALTADGRNVLSVETKFNENNNPYKQELIIYNISDNSQKVLISDEYQSKFIESKFGVTNNCSFNNEGLSVTNDNKVLVWFPSGFKLFQLS